ATPTMRCRDGRVVSRRPVWAVLFDRRRRATPRRALSGPVRVGSMHGIGPSLTVLTHESPLLPLQPCSGAPQPQKYSRSTVRIRSGQQKKDATNLVLRDFAFRLV